ncbi:MAG: energy transducer TonB [Flavobacteriales bacterium]|nr:energy transducer TonB [Flavobacteriales bacterium]
MEEKKSAEANLEKRKSALLTLGLVAGLAFTLVSFQWRWYDIQVEGLGEYMGDNLEDEIIPVSIQVQPPPPPPPKQEQVVMEIIEDESEEEETVDVSDTEVDEETEVEFIEEEEEEVVEEEIFTIVETMPSFPGGEKAMFEYLGKNTKYPTLAKESGIQGMVVLTFVVEKNGEITDVKVLRGIGGGCDEEAIRVVKNMPKWSPGKQRGKPVKVQYNLPYRFILQ